MKKFVVTIFGSSYSSEGDKEYQSAYELGKMLGTTGYIVCNGGYGGIMEASARGEHEKGGTTIGVITDIFQRKSNRYLTKIIKTKTHIERLLKLIELGDAYIVLPGSTGTLVELAFVWEYMAKGLIKRKPILAVGEFWKSVIDTVGSERIRQKLFLAVDFVTIVKNNAECLEILEKHRNNETF